MAANLKKATLDTIREAASIIRAGGLVAMPTETVYGLAADAANAEGVARIYEAKERPSFNPLIAHVNGLEMAAQQGRLEGSAASLAGAFWPGALTLVLPVTARCSVCELARAGLDTVALRHPGHPVAQELISAVGRPLVAPSANMSGRLSPVTAQDVANELGAKVDLILDGGRSTVGVESTVVSFASAHPTLLRPGGIERQALERVLGEPLHAPATGHGGAPASPGQLERHYAPSATLRLNVTTPEPGEVLIGFGPMDAPYSLSRTGNLKEAAAHLFPLLRLLEGRYDRIAVAPIPDTGLGEAINDRLRRAAKSSVG